MDSLCDLLLRRFPERFQLLEQRQGPGQRILATNFGRPSSRQELLLFQGDLLSGEIDLTLQYLLPLHPEAVAMVKTLKRWAFRCRLHQPGEGCFGWTLLVVFFLQQQGFLPPLEEFKRGEMPRLQPDPRELRELIFEFADFAISIWSRPHPRPSINIWKGRLDPVEASVPYTHPGDRAVVEELRRLRQEVGDPSRRLHRLGESGQLARQNFMRQFPDHDITGRTSSTPPPVARGRGAPHGARRDRAEIKPPTATSSMSRASSVSPLTAASAGRPPPPRSRWHIDESWVAYKTCQGRVVETVQLNPEEQGQLTREGWAQRFERREWQVHLGKITSEYERWEVTGYDTVDLRVIP